jgi:HEPN domain-containing protein
MDKKSIIKSWHDFANDDLAAAKYLLGLHPLKLEIICYHCQQSAEKILKGFLISKEIEPPRTHDLRLLRRMCGQNNEDFDDIEDACVRLSAYGVQTGRTALPKKACRAQHPPSRLVIYPRSWLT